jgi:hypothetical protein
MKKKTQKKSPGILHNCVIVPITDPVEIEALERRIRAAEKVIAAREAAPRKRSARKAK